MNSCEKLTCNLLYDLEFKLVNKYKIGRLMIYSSSAFNIPILKEIFECLAYDVGFY